MQKVGERIGSKKNVTFERFKLYKLHQTPGQKFEDFLTDVIEQVDKCEFTSNHDEIILYKLVGGIRNDDVRNALLSDADLKLDEAIEIIRALDFTSGKDSGIAGWKSPKLEMASEQESEPDQYSREGGSAEEGPADELLREYFCMKPTTSNKLYPTKKEVENMPREVDVIGSEVEIDWRGIDDHYVIEIYSNEPEENSGDVGGLGYSVEQEHVSCYHCGKWFKKYMLRRHMYERHFDVLGLPGPLKILACEWCDYTTFSKQNLDNHKTHHAGERLSCHLCSYSTTTTRSLNVHIGMKHGPEARLERSSWTKTSGVQVRYPCPSCYKVYCSKSSLETHLRRHTGETPYACGICDYRTASQSGLSSHIRKHSDERPFHCSICTYSSKQPHQMKRHMLQHTAEKPYGCKLCGKKFTQSVHVKRHMAVHTGEKPYVCEICGKDWAQKANMKAHMKVHFKGPNNPRRSWKRQTLTIPEAQSDESDTDPTFVEWVREEQLPVE